MDIYHVWCDLKPSVSDREFALRMGLFLGRLKEQGKLETWRLTRCKLGLAPDNLPEWHVMIETTGLAQLDEAFRALAPKSGPDHDVHFAANSLVQNLKFALYRDWPDEF